MPRKGGARVRLAERGNRLRQAARRNNRHIVEGSLWSARGPLQPLSPVNEVASWCESISLPAERQSDRRTDISNGTPRNAHRRRRIPAGSAGLQDVNAWMRVLSRCDAAFVDEELSVRWHHAGSATDDSRARQPSTKCGCSPISSTAPNSAGGARARPGLWFKALARCPKRLSTHLAVSAGRRSRASPPRPATWLQDDRFDFR